MIDLFLETITRRCLYNILKASHNIYQILSYIDLFNPTTPIITNISTKAGKAEQNENIHQYKLQSHTSNAKYPIATEAVA